MAADATINIDVVLSNLPKFQNDVSFVNEILNKLGMNAGSKMDESFKSETEAIKQQAESAKKKIDETIGKETKTKISADDSDVKRKATDAKEEVSRIPDKKETRFQADATQAKSETRELGDTAEKTEGKFISLKDKLSIGAVAGVASSAVQVITGSFGELIGQSVQASDAIDKFKSTMKLGGFGEAEINKASKEVKRYADDTVYDLSTVSNTTAQLAANSVKDYMGLTEAAGNLNAQAGGSAETFKSVAMVLTQTAGAGKLTTENWNQLADAIPGASGVLQKAMKDNGAYTGNFRDAMEKGQVSSDEFNKAITQLGSNDGAVKAAKSTSTFEGAVGSLQANIVSGINDIIKHLGKDKLTGIINSLSDGAVALFQKIADGVEWMTDHKKEVEVFAGAVATIFAVKKGLEFIRMIKEAKTALLELTAIEKVASAFGGEFSLPNISKKKRKGVSAASAGGEILDIADNLKPNKATAEIGEEAIESVAKVSKFAKVGGALSKALPFIGVLASASELLGKGGKGATSSKMGAFGGSLGGSAAGAAIGTAILPGIGTALGAGIGGLGGTELGKNLGKQIGKGFKEYAPGLTNLFGEVGHKISKAFSSKASSNAKTFSKNYTKEMDKLNSLAKKMPKNDKDIASQQKQTEKTFSAMEKSIDKYYKKKKKSSESDYDYFVKNGLMTQKEADKLLSKSEKNDSKAKTSHKKILDQMKKDSTEHYKKLRTIENGGTKELQKVAEVYGKNSKQYKKELNAELEKEQKDYAKKVSKNESQLNEQISKETKIASGKQIDLLEDLKNRKSKLSHEQMTDTILQSKKERDTVISNAKKTASNTIDSAQKKYKETVARADKERYENGTMSKKQYDEVVKNAKKERDDAISAATKRRDKSIEKAQETHKQVVNEATKQAGEHKGAVNAETGEVIGSWGDMKSKLKGIVNGVVDGINGMLNGLHKGWGKIPKWGAHAKGTSGLSEDEIALVGEEGVELAHHPTKGIFPIGVNGPEIRPLQAGTSILPHDMSMHFLSMTKGLPAHADGVWGAINNMYDWLKDKASDAASFVSDGASKLYEKITDKLGVSSFLDSLGDSSEQKLAKGAFETIKDKIVDYVQKLFDKFNSENGGTGTRGQFLKIVEAQGDKPYVWGAEGPDAFDCSGLVKWALGQLGIAFPHFSGAQFDATTPVDENNAKPGDLSFYGPGGSEHVGVVTGKNRMFAAQSPNSHPNIGPDSIHNGLPFAGIRRISQLSDKTAGGKGAPGGSGVERWRGQVRDALATNGLPTTSDYINAWMSQINTESSGNEKAVGGNDGLADGNATGLLQTKPGTFRAYAFPGHGEIMNGYDNMLAAIHYAKTVYGGNMLGVIGHGHGYADGGEIDRPTLAWIGEDPNYAKEFIINPAKPSADDLIQKAIFAREQFKPASSQTAVASSSTSKGQFITKNDLDQLVSEINKRPVKVDSYLDGKQVGHSVDQTNGSTFRRKLYTRGQGNV